MLGDPYPSIQYCCFRLRNSNPMGQITLLHFSRSAASCASVRSISNAAKKPQMLWRNNAKACWEMSNLRLKSLSKPPKSPCFGPIVNKTYLTNGRAIRVSINVYRGFVLKRSCSPCVVRFSSSLLKCPNEYVVSRRAEVAKECRTEESTLKESLCLEGGAEITRPSQPPGRCHAPVPISGPAGQRRASVN